MKNEHRENVQKTVFPPPRPLTAKAFYGLSEAQPLGHSVLKRPKGDITSSTVAEGGSGAAATAFGTVRGPPETAGLPLGKSEAASLLIADLAQSGLDRCVYSVAKHYSILSLRRKEEARQR